MWPIGTCAPQTVMPVKHTVRPSTSDTFQQHADYATLAQFSRGAYSVMITGRKPIRETVRARCSALARSANIPIRTR